MENIDLKRYSFDYKDLNFIYEIQYIQFMIELLEPYIEFNVVNTNETTTNLSGEPTLRKGLKIFVKKDHGIQESIDENQFIQFIQVEFPKVVKGKQQMFKEEMSKENQEKVEFEKNAKHTDRMGRNNFVTTYTCPQNMDQSEYDEKYNYYVDTVDSSGNSYKPTMLLNEPTYTLTRFALKMKHKKDKINTLENILKINRIKHSTVRGVIHFLNIVKDHYIFES
tara:strand:- start:95 stop:763 length:669 start_codon:yes stop_codon:yes gene_type:complete